ncbi:DMT family transporter [Amycolatopsis sp. H20-H5]|uniref:DMT family transporter n=1 Tax=Amycolatopsis sp. H20-H5 TaxID=3046309 RepID=UPI002DB8D0B7|nr:DMT family transporter [Amycolatopsis sp. H20-H5]MEC3981461.1 DMT family transporter [Amycolatopsis sp. H20-H5]
MTNQVDRPPPVTADSPGRLDALVRPLFVVLWSSAFIAAVFGTAAVPPLLLTFSRFAVAGVLLTAIALVSRSRWPRGRLLAHVVVTGLLMQAVQFGAFYLAIARGLPGGVVALVQGLNPVVIALLAGPVLGERITRAQWLGFGVGGAGVALAVIDQIHVSASGIVLCFVGLLGLGLGTVYQKRFAMGADLRSSTAVHFLAAAPVVGVASLLLETPRVGDWGAFGASLAWIVLVNSVGTFLLLNMMLRRQSAAGVGALFFLTPSVTALLAWLINGQTLDPVTILGLLLGGVGVLLAGRKA